MTANEKRRQKYAELRADPVAYAEYHAKRKAYELSVAEETRNRSRDRYANDPEYRERRKEIKRQAFKRNHVPKPVKPKMTEEEHKAKKHAYYLKIKPHHQQMMKNWAKNNPDKVVENARAYYARRDKKKMRENTRAWFKQKYDSDPVFRGIVYMRHRMRDLVKGIISTAACLKLVGCSLDELRAHLEKQFKPGMTWDNYGLQGWVIDHRVPIASIDMRDPEARARIFNFKNLQPLWADENLKKSAKIIPELLEAYNG